MNSADVRQTIDQESNDATQELLDIPGFIESFERGKKDITEGRVTPHTHQAKTVDACFYGHPEASGRDVRKLQILGRHGFGNRKNP